MNSPTNASTNIFLSGPLGSLFARTAIPIIFIMGMNGLLTVIDAYFLGVYVGASALAGVTLIFPVFMLLNAMATLVASGMASVIARQLGAAEITAARTTLANAQALALCICALLIAGFAVTGNSITDWLANGSQDLADTGYTYISILIWCSPFAFLLSVYGDALRSEGRVGFMAAASLGVSLANIAFNYLLIVMFGLGVAGSAIGTVLAQCLALAVIAIYGGFGGTRLGLVLPRTAGWRKAWPQFLALGAPQSLSFVGISLGSAAIILALHIWNPKDYSATVAAYGIALRILTFAFLPLLGLSLAMQTLVGNNVGAQQWARSDAVLRMALAAALAYGVCIEMSLFKFSGSIGFAFVEDARSVSELGRILPIMTAMYFSSGPVMMLAGYCQAIGDPVRAAILGLSRTYLFAIPLTFMLPIALGETGIWVAAPAAETAMIAIAFLVLANLRARKGLRWGIFGDRS